MTLIGLGDMAQTFMLRRMTTGMKQDAGIAAQELTTGRSMDVSQKLQGEFSGLAGVEAALSRLQGYRVATDTAALTTSAMQGVLGTIDDITSGIGASLIGATMLDNTRTFGSLVQDSAQRFGAVLAALNSRVGDQALFAGVAGDGPAMASADTILSALETHITATGATTATDIETAVTSWFQAPTGFATVAYLGAAGRSAMAISAEDKADMSITATDPALRDTIKSLAIVALIDRGTVVADANTAVSLAQQAGNSLLQNHSDRAVLAGRLGLTQARIDQAQTRNTAEGSALQIARSDLLSVDPYEAATRLQNAQNQLETLYSVTARLSRLSLVDFLR